MAHVDGGDRGRAACHARSRAKRRYGVRVVMDVTARHLGSRVLRASQLNASDATGLAEQGVRVGPAYAAD